MTIIWELISGEERRKKKEEGREEKEEKNIDGTYLISYCLKIRWLSFFLEFLFDMFGFLAGYNNKASIYLFIRLQIF